MKAQKNRRIAAAASAVRRTGERATTLVVGSKNARVRRRPEGVGVGSGS